MQTTRMFKRFLAAVCAFVVTLTGVFPVLAKTAHAHMSLPIAHDMSMAEQLHTAMPNCGMLPVAALTLAQPATLSWQATYAVKAYGIATSVTSRDTRTEFSPEHPASNRIRAPNDNSR